MGSSQILLLQGERQPAVRGTADALLPLPWSKAQLQEQRGIAPIYSEGGRRACLEQGRLQHADQKQWAWPFCVAVLAYMQFVEDYSEPQPSMFYQTPQNEHIYQQKNKHLREVYGINDSFISLEPSQDLAPPPALPPKQRQLVSDIRGARPSRAQQPRGSSSGFAASPSDGLRLWEDGCLIGVVHLVFLAILLTRF